MIGLNALDGFDVLSISFAAPGIAADWGINRAALGIVLSMELFGMAVGAVLLGKVADTIGRRPTILGCLCLMTAGMASASMAHDVLTLCIWRVITGLGIGGMLAATNAATAEASNAAHRELTVILMAAGYPLGAVVGGSIASVLLGYFTWQSVFVFGAVTTALFIPIVLLGAPESLAFELQGRRHGALRRANAILIQMGQKPLRSLPSHRSRPQRRQMGLLSNHRLKPLLLLTSAYLGHIMTFYFVLKWIPKIVADLGHAPASAAGVLVWANIGGMIGAITLGVLAMRVRLLSLTIATMLASAALVTFFGLGQSDLERLSIVAAMTGFCTNAGVVGLYAIVARAFETEVRATATGFVIGIGRGGSAAAPALAGLLFQAGFSLAGVATTMALGSAIGAAALALLAWTREGTPHRS